MLLILLRISPLKNGHAYRDTMITYTNGMNELLHVVEGVSETKDTLQQEAGHVR